MQLAALRSNRQLRGAHLDVAILQGLFCVDAASRKSGNQMIFNDQLGKGK